VRKDFDRVRDHDGASNVGKVGAIVAAQHELETEQRALLLRGTQDLEAAEDRDVAGRDARHLGSVEHLALNRYVRVGADQHGLDPQVVVRVLALLEHDLGVRPHDALVHGLRRWLRNDA